MRMPIHALLFEFQLHLFPRKALLSTDGFVLKLKKYELVTILALPVFRVEKE